MHWGRTLIFSGVFHKLLFSLVCWERKFICGFFETHDTIIYILSSEVKYFPWSISTKASKTHTCLSMTAVLPVTRNISKDKSTSVLPDIHKRQIKQYFLSEFLQILEKFYLQTNMKVLNSCSISHFTSAWSVIFPDLSHSHIPLWHMPCYLHGTSCSSLVQLRSRKAHSDAKAFNLVGECVWWGGMQFKLSIP